MNKKILIIEDDVFLGDVLLQKLTKEGFDTTLARDGKEGFDKIKSLSPDLILLDIILPNMNGYEILEAKFKDPSILQIPVIVISNSGQPVEINRILSLGVRDYLVKAQFDPEEVLQKVKSQLTKEEVVDSKLQFKSSIDLEGKKIVWVEDDKFLNDIISRKLSSMKCSFFGASEGGEAIEIIQREIPDIIMLDIILSGMDGFEILRKIKLDPKIKHIPVIVLSNLGQSAEKEKAKTLGAELFLVKATVTLDDIINEMKRVISEHSK
jgi:CheY-like chemotaxis protein